MSGGGGDPTKKTPQHPSYREKEAKDTVVKCVMNAWGLVLV